MPQSTKTREHYINEHADISCNSHSGTEGDTEAVIFTPRHFNLAEQMKREGLNCSSLWVKSRKQDLGHLYNLGGPWGAICSSWRQNYTMFCLSIRKISSAWKAEWGPDLRLFINIFFLSLRLPKESDRSLHSLNMCTTGRQSGDTAASVMELQAGENCTW